MSTANKEFVKNSVEFIDACANAHALPTKRQASKFRNKKIVLIKKGGLSRKKRSESESDWVN
jgi:hypothetical protein